MSNTDIVEKVYAGRLKPREDGYYVVPTSLFIAKVDVKMPPLPEVAFYQDKNGKVEVLRQPDQKYSPLALSAHETILIKNQDFEAVQKFAEARILGNSQQSEPKEKRMDNLRKAAILVVEDLFQNPSEENIRKSTRVVGNLVSVMMREPESYLHLATLSSHDPYTLQHSVGTAVNCIILGRKAQIKDEQELSELGMGGLLHDIGKIHVRTDIINKEGPLNEEEWEEMKEHSSLGYEIIKDNSQLTERVKRAVLEHHEDKLGNGYPSQMAWDSIHYHAKIVAMADVFNALTTTRSYSKARTPFEAFKLMKDKIMHKLDEELFGYLVRVYGGQIDDLKE